MTLPKNVLIDPQEFNKAIRWLIVFEIICAVAIICAIIFVPRPVPKSSTDADFIQEMRRSNAEHRAALIRQDNEAQLRDAESRRKDSLLKIEFESTRSEIKKSRNITNEKITRINGFGSADIQREYAKLDSSGR